MMNWYAIYAARNAVIERKSPDSEQTDFAPPDLLDRLRDRNCDVFYPKARVLKRRKVPRSGHTITKSVWEPVFGRYVFFGTAGDAWEISGIRGVQALIRNADGNPGTVPAEHIEFMRKKYREYTAALKYEETPLKRGQTVRIMSGPLIGYEAKVHLIDLAKGMLTAVREAMGREMPVQIPIEDVEAVSS